MSIWYSLSLLALTAAASILLTLAILVWQRRTVLGATAAEGFLLAVTAWLIGYIFELSLPHLEDKLLFAKVEYIGIVIIPVAFLLFALQYAGYDWWLTRSKALLLSVIPAITVFLVWTNEFHHLIWRQVSLDQNGVFVTLKVMYGSWFWVHTIYSYLLLLAGLFFIVLMFIRAPRFYRPQVVVILIGGIVPWFVNILYTSRLGPLIYLDLTPFALAITGVTLTWGLFRYHLLDITPIARAVVLENMQDGVIVLDRQNRILTMNPAAMRYTGICRQDMTGYPMESVFGNWPSLVACLADPEPQYAELTRDRDGAEMFISVRTSALRNPRGRQLGRLVILHDLTDQKKLETTLRTNQARLREMVIQLRELDELKSKFIADVSHELRTPLTNIKLYLNLLQSGRKDQLENYVRTLQEETDKLQRLIETVLDFSDLDMMQERGMFEPVPVDLRRVVEDSMASCVASAELSYIALTSQLPPQRIYTLGNSEQLVTAIANLISNAIKYTEPGGQVSVSLQLDGEHAEIRVQDTGMGIPLEEQAHLFERFYRGEQAKALGLPGTGLGLSIVREIIDLHDGEIRVESQPGQGSTFVVRLACVEIAGKLADMHHPTAIVDR